MKRVLAALAVGLAFQASTLWADVIQDWTAPSSGMYGPYNDSTGSKVDFAFDNGPKGGQKALKITYNLVANGYVGVYSNTSADLSKSKSLKFMAKSTAPGGLIIAIKDGYNVQYFTKTAIPSKDWSEVDVPLASFAKDPNYTPPDAIPGHPMDLSKVSNLNFSPQTVGAGVVYIGPVESVGGGSSTKAAASSSSSPSGKAPGPTDSKLGILALDFTNTDANVGSPMADSQGSSCKYILVDNPAKPGSKYMKVDYNLVAGGWCGLYYRVGTTWDGEDWSKLSTIKMLVYSKTPITLTVCLKDKNNNQYRVNAPSTEGNGWEKVEVPLDSFALDPYYTPPDAIKGAPRDFSAVKQMQLQPQTGGKNTFAVDDVRVVK